jgi:head-tail adaptor
MSFKGLLNTTCTIQEITETQDSGTGQKEKTWSNIKNGVKCRLDQASGKEFAAPNSIMAKASHILFLDSKYNLKEKNHRIIIKSTTYNILLVSDGGGHGHHLELLLEIIQ